MIGLLLSAAFAQEAPASNPADLWVYVVGVEELRFWPNAAKASGAVQDCMALQDFFTSKLGATRVTSLCGPEATYGNFFTKFPVGVPAGDTIMFIWVGMAAGGQFLPYDTDAGEVSGLSVDKIDGFVRNSTNGVNVVVLADAYREGELMPSVPLRGPIGTDMPDSIDVAYSATNGTKPSSAGLFTHDLLFCWQGAAKDQDGDKLLDTSELVECLRGRSWEHGLTGNSKVSQTFELAPYEEAITPPAPEAPPVATKPLMSRSTRRILGGASLVTGAGLGVASLVTYGLAQGKANELGDPSNFPSESSFNDAKNAYGSTRTTSYVLRGAAIPFVVGGGVLIVF